jgi:predicted RNA methylase
MGRLNHHSPKSKVGEDIFSTAYHLEMVTDRRRVLPFLEAIERAANRDKVFLEVGCGSGIFSKHAAARFKRVIAIEKDPVIFKMAQNNLVHEIQLGNVELINRDAMEIAYDLISESEVIFCEMMSTWLIVEPQVNVVKYIRDCLRGRKALLIPSVVYSTIELVWANFEPFGISIPAHYTEFTGVVPAESISLEVLAWKADFGADALESVREGVAAIDALLSGTVNAVRLRSYVQVGDGIPFSGSDTLMPPTVIPLTAAMSVNAGERVEMRWKIAHGAPLEQALFSISRFL